VLGCGVLVVRYPDRPVHHPVVTTYVVAMLFFSIRALRQGPEREMAEGRITLAMMSLFMGFFGLLTVLGLMTDPWGGRRRDLPCRLCAGRARQPDRHRPVRAVPAGRGSGPWHPPSGHRRSADGPAQPARLR
jgi:hypothetical protein